MKPEHQCEVYDFAEARAARAQRDRNATRARISGRHPYAHHAETEEGDNSGLTGSLIAVSMIAMTMSMFFLVATAGILVVLGHHYGVWGFLFGLLSIVGFVSVTVKNGMK